MTHETTNSNRHVVNLHRNYLLKPKEFRTPILQQHFEDWVDLCWIILHEKILRDSAANSRELELQVVLHRARQPREVTSGL